MLGWTPFHRPLARIPIDMFEDNRWRSPLRADVWSVLELFHRLRRAWLLMESQTVDVNFVVDEARHQETILLEQLVKNPAARWMIRMLKGELPFTRKSLLSLLEQLSERAQSPLPRHFDDETPLHV